MKLTTLVCCVLAAVLFAGCRSADPRVGKQVAVIAVPADLPAPPAAEPAQPPPEPVAAAEPAASAAAPEPPASTAVTEASPAPAPPPAPAAAPEPARPQRAAVIYFKPDAYKVDARYRELLRSHARRLKANPRLHMIIEAHADGRGQRDYNLALSKKRAETVAKHLKAQGVPARQLEIVYRGEGGGERVAAAERRVELLVVAR
jgi:peptidoglycan-associated lipoprotein